MLSNELQKKLNATWTVQDLCERFGVTPMTVHLWRAPKNGSRKTKLPVVVVPGRGRPAVRFIPQDVLDWAKVNKVPMRKPRKRAA